MSVIYSGKNKKIKNEVDQILTDGATHVELENWGGSPRLNVPVKFLKAIMVKPLEGGDNIPLSMEYCTLAFTNKIIDSGKKYYFAVDTTTGFAKLVAPPIKEIIQAS